MPLIQMPDLRTAKEGKVRAGLKNRTHYSMFTKGQFNLASHDISLMSATTNDAIITFIHEFMHKTLWEDPEIPEGATFDWDEIAQEVLISLGFKSDTPLNWKGLQEIRKSIKEEFRTKLD